MSRLPRPAPEKSGFTQIDKSVAEQESGITKAD
jgi:hypothetical protein